MAQNTPYTEVKVLAGFDFTLVPVGAVCWHVHHGRLLEPAIAPLIERARYIIRCKPAFEVPIRLKLIRPVKGLLPAAVTAAARVYTELGVAYDKANNELQKACRRRNEFLLWATYGPEKDAAVQAEALARVEHQAAGDRVMAAESEWLAVVREYGPALKKLHDAECKDCPWNGHTIFQRPLKLNLTGLYEPPV